MKKINIIRVFSLILSVILILSSCATPQSTNTSSKRVAMLNTDNSFSIQSARDGCPTLYITVNSKGNCPGNDVLKQNGQVIFTSPDLSLGSHPVKAGCQCGVDYNMEYSYDSCVSGRVTKNSVLNYPCPNSVRPSNAPKCPSDSKSMDSKLIYNTFSKSGFNRKSYSSLNIAESVNELISKIKEIEKLQSEYDNLNTRGDTTKKDVIGLEKQAAITQRNFIKQDIITGLNIYKFDLRNKVNTLMEDPNFSVDDTDLSLNNLQDYQNKISDFEDFFDLYLELENSFDVVYSLSILADEIQILTQLIEDISNHSLIDIQSNNITLDLNDIYSLNNQFQILTYLSSKVSFQKDKVNIEIMKLNENYDEEVGKIILFNTKSIIYLNGFMIGMGIIDPITLQLKNNSFHIADATSDYFDSEKFWSYIGSKENKKYVEKSLKELWGETKQASKSAVTRLINSLDTALSIPDKLTKPIYEYAIRKAPGGNKLTNTQVSNSADTIVTGVGLASMFINPKEIGHLILHPKKLLEAKPLLLKSKEALERLIDDAIENGDYQKVREFGKEKKDIDNLLKEVDILEEKVEDELLQACKAGKIKQTFKLDEVLTDPKLKDYRKKHHIPENIDLGSQKKVVNINNTTKDERELNRMLKEASNNQGEWKKVFKPINNPIGNNKELHYFENQSTNQIFNPKAKPGNNF